MTHIETLKLALEEMRRLARLANVDHSENAGVVALEQAIEQAEQAQPVAWANPNDLQSFDMKVRTNGGPLHTVPLYTAPPPSKPWVGLTDEEREEICDDYRVNIHWRAFQAIEAKLKEKNT